MKIRRLRRIFRELVMPQRFTVDAYAEEKGGRYALAERSNFYVEELAVNYAFRLWREGRAATLVYREGASALLRCFGSMPGNAAA